MLLPLMVTWALVAFAASVDASISSDKIAKFSSLAAKRNGLIQLDSKLYDEITSAPRNYSVSIVLTALQPQYKCNP